MPKAPEKNPFFALTLTRSGSTWLLTLLNGQDGVAAYEELFLPREVSDRYAWVADGSPERFFTRRSALRGPRPRKIWRYLDEVEQSSDGQRFVGFKLMLGQLRDVPELLPILALRGYRMVALVRDNLFDLTLVNELSLAGPVADEEPGRVSAWPDIAKADQVHEHAPEPHGLFARLGVNDGCACAVKVKLCLRGLVEAVGEQAGDVDLLLLLD